MPKQHDIRGDVYRATTARTDHRNCTSSYTEDDASSAGEKLALTYAERITRSDQDIDDALFARLQEAFVTPEAIVELTASENDLENLIRYFQHKSTEPK